MTDNTPSPLPCPWTELRRFEANYLPEPNTGCWLWTASVTDTGYGQFRAADLPSRKAHRWAYLHFRGPIPSGMVLDHLCRVRCCVNPWHLEVVTDRTNILRGIRGSAVNSRKTHCPRGHLLAGDTLYYQPSRPARRECGICKTAKNAARDRRKNNV